MRLLRQPTRPLATRQSTSLPGGAVAAEPPGRLPVRRPWGRRLLPYALLAPALLVLGGMLVYPLAYVAVESFFDVAPLRHVGWGSAGVGNYARLLHDHQVEASILRTITWTVLSVVLQFLIGLAVALALRRPFRGRLPVRMLILVPWATPAIVGALAWKWVYHGQYGLLNSLLGSFGLGGLERAWLGDPSTALGAVIAANVWRGFPFIAVLLGAALANLPAELHEAAEIDGASRWQELRHVTLPQLRPAIVLATLLSGIWTFNNFSTIYILTGGGPAGRTDILVTFVYRNGFQFFEFGYAAALSVMLFAIVLVPSIFYVRRLGEART
jgi:multiple sugar transport system permease protein